jgi:hypothetical protein
VRETATIVIDGEIVLVDCQDGESSPDAERARLSRLADVMIVLEREQAALEGALRERLGGVQLGLELDETAPRFKVTIEPAPGDDHHDDATLTPPGEISSLTSEIEVEIRGLIERRAVSSTTPRWRPQVIAKRRGAPQSVAGDAREISAEPVAQEPGGKVAAEAPDPGEAEDPEVARQRRLKSFWLLMLFWLLAAVVLGTTFLALHYAT